MSDYTKTTNFTAKDNLTTGDPLKVIKGSYFDTEFDNIATAVATKYDSGNLASQAQAEALTLDTVLLTPHSLNDVLVDNDGILSQLQAIDATAADGIFGWDSSAAADSEVVLFTMGTGLVFNGTTLELDFLGLEDLTDPNDDRILFWDDSAGNLAWLDLSSDFSISGTTVSLASTIATQTITTLTATTIALDGANLTANADVLEWGNQAMFMHNSTSYEGSEVYFSTSAASGGNNGDIWFQYTA
jgi:hypothetical protein